MVIIQRIIIVELRSMVWRLLIMMKKRLMHYNLFLKIILQVSDCTLFGLVNKCVPSGCMQLTVMINNAVSCGKRLSLKKILLFFKCIRIRVHMCILYIYNDT